MMMYIKPRSGKKIKFPFWSDSLHWLDASLVRRLTQLASEVAQISVWVARLMKSTTFGLGHS